MLSRVNHEPVDVFLDDSSFILDDVLERALTLSSVMLADGIWIEIRFVWDLHLLFLDQILHLTLSRSFAIIVTLALFDSHCISYN